MKLVIQMASTIALMTMEYKTVVLDLLASGRPRYGVDPKYVTV